VAAGTITVLKRAVPSVDRVNNPRAASGGADLENVESVKDRGPLVIKHRNRAVTAEDYESLARQASRQVVRAKAIPARDALTAGKVSVLIVPEGGPRPIPSPALIHRVRSYLDARRLPTADITLFGPTYVDVWIDAQVSPSGDDDVEAVRQRVVDALTAFLHPLTGGPGGKGWDFGRDVYISEVAERIEAIDGVDHLVRGSLSGQVGTEDRTRDGGRRVEVREDAGELVASGVHTVTLVL
jgi:predicted phage baseplate assembly protein